MKEQVKWESYENMIARKKRNEKRRQTRELRKKLLDPATPPEEKDRLMEELYRDIKILYVEPEDYFPKAFRKKYKLGEYAEPEKAPEKEGLVDCGEIKVASAEQSLSGDDKKENE